MRLISAAAAFPLPPFTAHAEDDSSEQIDVEARHGYMMLVAANLASLAAMAKDEMPFSEGW